MMSGVSLPPGGDVTRIVVLALLAQRPRHGYAIRHVIERRNMHHWADVKLGSIYAVLRRLEREGLVEAAGVTRSGRHPPATLYRVTVAGEEELRRLLHHVWAEPVRWAQPIDVALSFFDILPPEHIEALLKVRLDALTGTRAWLAEGLRAFCEQAQREGVPRGVVERASDVWEHHLRLLATETAWIEHVRERIRSGAYRLSDEDRAWLREYEQARLPESYEDWERSARKGRVGRRRMKDDRR